MKRAKRAHGMNRIIDDFFKELYKHVGRKTTNNWRKMHNKPLRRKGGIY